MKINIKILFWLFTLLYISEVKSQNYFNTYQNLDFNKEYSVLKEEVDSLLLHTKGNVDAVKISDDFSKKIWNSQLDDAIYYVNISIRLLELEKNQKKALSALYFRRGYFCFRKGENLKALADYNKVIELNAAPSRIAQSYCEIGFIHLEQGDLYEAVRFYKEGIRILEELKDYKKLVNQYLNLAIVYDEIASGNALKNKLAVLQRVESLRVHVTLNSLQEISLNNNLALLFTELPLFDFNKAKKYHFKNLALYSEYDDLENMCKTYANLADLYNTIKNDSAKVFIDKGINLCTDTITVAKYKHHLSTFYRNNKVFDKALEKLQQSLNLVGRFNEKVNDVPSFSKLEKLPNKAYLINVFIDKSKLLFIRGKKNKNLEDLSLALMNIKIADKLLSHLQNENQEKESKLHWRSKASEVYVLGVSVAKLLDDTNSAFYFTEKNKAILLIEGIKENVDDKFPIKIKERKRTLKERILQLENGTGKVSKNELFQRKQQYREFIDSLKIIFPTYNKFKRQTKTLDIKQTQKKIKENTAIVSYIWNTDDKETPILYGVIITKNKADIFEVKETKQIAALVTDFRKSVSQPFDTTDDRDKFQEMSYNLYQLLFPEGKIRKLLVGKNVVIIPDGELQYIPFEALITNQKNNEYFIEKHQVNYAYSASFLIYNNGIKRKFEKSFTGFAPVSFLHNNLNALKRSENELNRIYDITGGQQFLNTNATKETFFSTAPKSTMLHLATHADASGNPWIAFYDSKLGAHELYISIIPTELVVLSGCDTSLGKISQGEGVMSLSRGFFHAGANTVASTLWNANDKSTAVIMSDFYKNLKVGESKVKALHNAKLKYLETANLSEKAPYYWAPMILMGDGETVLYTPLWVKLLWGFGILILLLIFFFFWKCNK